MPSALEAVRAEIRTMRGYTPGEQLPGALKLNTNECAFPPSPRVRTVLAELAADRLRLYPDPRSEALRQAAGRIFGVRPGQVLVGNGSDDCLTVLFRALLRPDEPVAAPWPSYGLYHTCAQLQGCPLAMVPWDGGLGVDGWRLPVAALAATKARLVLIANPNNPSATLVPPAELERLARAMPTSVILVDEAYIDYAPTGSSCLPLLDRLPNLVVIRTFSKSYALAGARLGLLFANEALVDELMKVKDSYNVNALTQAVGLAALEDQAYHRNLVAETLALRDRLAVGLREFGWSWPATAGNFILATVHPRWLHSVPSEPQVEPTPGNPSRAVVSNDPETLYLRCKERGVLVRWWNTPELKGCLRITVGRDEDHERLFEALRWAGA
jgi:histidinol-phosphate aminotransferase